MKDDKIVIEINLADVVVARGEEGQAFGEYLATVAAGMLLERSAGEGGYYQAELVRRVRTIRDEEIRDALRPLIEEALADSFRSTGTFGEPRGEELTLREMIAAQVKFELHPSAQRGRGKTTLIEEVIAQEVRVVLKKELSEAVDEGRRTVLGAVKEQAAELLEQTIARMARG